jgi:phage FluMu gp28-like protein
MPEQSLIDYFFPYQKRYLLDKSKVKILEKSRRIGGTYVQSFEDVQDCIEQPGLKIFFSSADMTAAAEYMDYISGWVAKLNTIAKALAEINCEDISECEFADEDKGVKSKVIEFNNGSKIYALSSNPKAFRSKGGKIVWDEAAHHKDDRKMWAAAKPAAMWGFSIRILSTHNGVNSLFYILIDKCRKGELDYSVHTVPIQLAVEEGVADRICGRKLSRKEREAWLENEHKGCLTEAIWQEEYCCNPQDESKSMIGYDLIHSCERQGVLGMEKAKGPLYLGCDVARHRHLYVIYVFEDIGNQLVCRAVEAYQKKKWSYLEEKLYKFLKLPNLIRACIDRTGLGDQFTERAQEKFGSVKVEGVLFTNTVKADLAISLLQAFEDQKIIIEKCPKFPGVDGNEEDKQAESIHAVKKIVTSAGNVRYDAASTEQGHGDFFWGAALAYHAKNAGEAGPLIIQSAEPYANESTDFGGF